MFLGLIVLYFLNSENLIIFNNSLDISVNLIFLLKNSSTNLSFALTIIVSNKEFISGNSNNIFTTGNLVELTLFNLRLFSIFNSSSLVLIFFQN